MPAHSSEEAVARLTAAFDADVSGLVVLHGGDGVGVDDVVDRWAARHGRQGGALLRLPTLSCWTPIGLIRELAAVSHRLPGVFGRAGGPVVIVDARSGELPSEDLRSWARTASHQPRLVLTRAVPPGFEASSIRLGGLSVQREGRRDFAAEAQQRVGGRAKSVEALFAPLPAGRADSVVQGWATLVERSDDQPLALEWAAALATAVGLHEARRRFDASAGCDDAVDDSALGRWLDALWPELSPSQRRLLDLFVALPPGLSVRDARALCAQGGDAGASPALEPDLRALSAWGLVRTQWRDPIPIVRLHEPVRRRVAARLPCARRAELEQAWAQYLRRKAEREWAGGRWAFETLGADESTLRHVVYASARVSLPDEHVANALGALDDLYHRRSSSGEWALLSARIAGWLQGATPGATPRDFPGLHWRVGRHRIRQIDAERALPPLLKALGRPVDGAAPRVSARSALSLAVLRRFAGEQEEWARDLAAVEAAADAAEDAELRGLVALERLVEAKGRLDLEAALGHAEVAEAALGFCLSPARTYLEAQTATILRWMGRFDAARAGYAGAARRGQGAEPDSLTLGLCALGTGALYAETGDVQRAQRELAEATTHLAHRGGWVFLPELYSEQAAVLEAAGDAGESQRLACLAEELLGARRYVRPCDGLLLARLAAMAARSGRWGSVEPLKRAAERALTPASAAGARLLLAVHWADVGFERSQGWGGPCGGRRREEAARLLVSARALNEALPGRWEGVYWLERALGERNGAAAAEVCATIEATARWIDLPEGRFDLVRRPVARRLLQALLAHHLAHPGSSLSTSQLVQAVWENDASRWESLTARLYSMVWDLRRRGLGDVVDVDSGGYRLHPAVLVAGHRPAGDRVETAPP